MATNGLGAPVVIVGGQLTGGTINGIPDALITGGGINGIAPRLRVDVAETSFFAKRDFRSFYEFSQPLGTSIPNGQRVIIRFVSTVDFIIHSFNIIGDNGQIRAVVNSGGTPTGTFSTSLPVFSANSMSEGPAQPASNMTISMAGPGLPAAVAITGGTTRDVIRLKIENSTGAAASVGATQDSERGLPAGTVYVLIDNIGTGVFEGVVSARWEQRTN